MLIAVSVALKTTEIGGIILSVEICGLVSVENHPGFAETQLFAVDLTLHVSLSCVAFIFISN